ncbi:MAG: hypothetical protein WCV55_00710 [Candidatus Paceibacterota bacterium]
MEPNVIQKLEEQEKKIDQIYVSVEKTRKYFEWTLYITIALFVLPLIAMMFVLPSVMSVYTNPQSLGL